MAEELKINEMDEIFMSDNENDEQNMLEITEKWNPYLLEACKTGDILKLQEAIDNGADIW